MTRELHPDTIHAAWEAFLRATRVESKNEYAAMVAAIKAADDHRYQMQLRIIGKRLKGAA